VIGDLLSIGISGEVTIIHNDGSVTVRLNGYDFPVTTRTEFSPALGTLGFGKRRQER
jgi:hypothetical protein